MYWFGPIIGGTLGGVLYEVVFASTSSYRRMAQCLLVSNECSEPLDPEPVKTRAAAPGVPEPERVALKQDVSLSVEEADEEDDEKRSLAADQKSPESNV